MKEISNEKSSKFVKFNFRFYEKSISVPNKMIFNPDIKDSSLRLLSALEALPQNWNVNQGFLAKMLGWGKEKMQGAISNLIELGYLRRSQKRENGRFAHFVYEFHWQPIFKNNANIQQDEMPDFSDTDDGFSGIETDGGKPAIGEPASTGYIYDNIYIKEPPTPEVKKNQVSDGGLVGGFSNACKEEKVYECLKKIDVPEHDKSRLTKKFDEATVLKAITHCTSPSFKIKKTLVDSIFYFCMNPSYISESKQEKAAKKIADQEKKIEEKQNRYYLAGQIRKILWQKARQLQVDLNDAIDYFEISNDRIREKIYYTSERFYIEVAHFLKKVGLEVPKIVQT